MPIPVSINEDDVSIGPTDRVVITNTELLNALVQIPDKTLQFLTSIGPIKPGDISIDPEGRVVIANSEFAKAIRSKAMSSPGAGLMSNNLGCGNITCG